MSFLFLGTEFLLFFGRSANYDAFAPSAPDLEKGADYAYSARVSVPISSRTWRTAYFATRFYAKNGWDGATGGGVDAGKMEAAVPARFTCFFVDVSVGLL